MSDFDRTIISPRKVSYPVMTPGYDSWGQSGKPQLRLTNQLGRTWTEEYPPMRATEANTKKFLAYINDLWRNRTIFTIQNIYMGTPVNAPITGAIVLASAGQTGRTINIVPTSLSQKLLFGDVITILGINIVFDVVGDMATTSDTTLLLNPPITSGMIYTSPYTVTYNNVKFRCVLDEGVEFPTCEEGVYTGLTLKFREAA